MGAWDVRVLPRTDAAVTPSSKLLLLDKMFPPDADAVGFDPESGVLSGRVLAM